MRVLVATIVGYLAGRLMWLAARRSFTAPALARENYRGRLVPTAAGLLIPVAAFLVEAGRVMATALGIGPSTGLTAPWLLNLLTASGFALFGAIDDLVGSPEHQGFRGHLGASMRGTPTTGLLKLVGGACVAIAVVGPLANGATGRLLADAALVALAANLGNLLDRAPGRTIKSSALAFAILLAAVGTNTYLAPAATVVGAGLGLLLDDLHERLMLGDAGSNAIGAALGLGVVMSTAASTRNLVLAGLVVMNLAGELISFSRVIEAVPPLRAFDRAGRRD